jgi:hypothetical protein
LAQQKRVALGADALAFFHQRILLTAFYPSLLLGLGRDSDQLQPLLITIELIGKIAR